MLTTQKSITDKNARSRNILKSQIDAVSQVNKKIQISSNKITNLLSVTQRMLLQNTINKSKHNALKSLPKLRQSIPYRLFIKKLYNIPSPNKKSSGNSLFLRFSATLCLKRTKDQINDEIQVLGETAVYQCQQSLFRKEQHKHEIPISFYYHSKSDKNSHSLFLAVSIFQVQMRANIVQNTHFLGFFIVQNPLVEANQQGILLCKEQAHQFDYLKYDDYTRMPKGNQYGKVDYQIGSYIQLKKLLKMIPQNTIFTTNTKVIGLNEEYLPNDYQIHELIQTGGVNIKFKYLQVHITDDYEIKLMDIVKKYPNSLFSSKEQIKNRKILIGVFNGATLINTVERKLQYFDKQKSGDICIIVYQGMKDGQTINMNYYLEQKEYSIGVLLIYQIGDRQIQVAQYLFNPITNSQSHDISQQMNTTSMNFPIKASSFIKCSSNPKPTIILQYVSQQILDDESFINNNSIHKNSSNPLLKSSHKLIQDKTLQLKQKQRLLQQIQYQRLSLQRQRGEVQKMKSQNYVIYQDEFQRKLQVQKANLLKRQQLLEMQYRQQVQRQIKQRFQLEEQIKKMKQKMKQIESNQHGSLNNTNAFYSHQSYQQQNQPSNYLNGPLGGFTGQINLQQQQRSGNVYYQNNQNTNLINIPHLIKDRIDPAYLIQPQNSIPVAKVRQIMKKNPINKDLLQMSKNQYNRASKFTLTFSSVVWYENVALPNEMYFVIRFFNFPQYKTDKLTYLTNDNQNGYCQLIRVNQHNYNLDDTTPMYSFTVDPSQYKNPKILQQDLITYMAQNNCIIDIFDGQTHIYMGQINIKLSQLIRGNKNQSFIAKQYNLIKIKTKQNLGLIQILVKNEQTLCKQSYSLKQNTTVKQQKRKVVSYSPMVVPSAQNILSKTNQKISSTNLKDHSNRMQQRIYKFKERQRQRKVQDYGNNFQNLKQQQKKNFLAKISDYKQKNINQYIKTVYSSLLHQTIKISSQFGKAQTFPYTFVNQSTYASSYKIVIDLGEGQQKQLNFQKTKQKRSSDLQVVKQSQEWRYYVKRRGYIPPKFYQIINQNDVFYLNAGQSLSMVFRYLSFTHQDKFHQDVIINVSIVKIDSNWIAGGFCLKIEPHQPVIHHSYILYEPGNQVVDLILPVIYSNAQEYGSSSIKKLFLTDQDQQTQAQWLNQYQILLRISTSQIMHRKTFNLLLYDDEYFDQLKQNWLIVVNSYEGVWAQSRPDSNTKFKLALPISIVPINLGSNLYSSFLNSTLIVNSGDPSLIFDNNKILVQFAKIREEGAYQIWCQLVSGDNFKKQIEITCTSQQSSLLVYGWIVQIFPYSIKRN